MSINKALRAALCLALLMVLLCAPALAKVVSPGADFYYLDEVDVLSEDLEGEIYFSNQLLNKECGAQIVVVAVETTGSEPIDDYAYDLFNKWRIGDPQKQNGLLILLAIDDDDYYVEPGTGLQSKLSAGAIKSYNDEYLEPDFAKGEYDAGVRKLFEALFKRVADTYSATATTQQGIEAYNQYIAANSGEGDYGGYQTITGGRGRDVDAAPSGGGSGLGIVLIILVIVLIVVLAKRSSRRRVARRTTVSDDIATMYMADRLLRNAQRSAPPIIPSRPSRGYRPMTFGGYSAPSRPSGGSSGGGLFGGSSHSGGSTRSGGGLFGGSSGGGSSFRSSGGGFGGGSGGGGGSRGGGAGRGRH